MRWLARRQQRPRSLDLDPIDRIDPATLEVVELDRAGRLHGPPPARSIPQLAEIGYAPRDRDPTGLAGVWEAVARS